MVNFDKFEKRVKETYGKQEFPFDEQNWEKARKMIDASRQGKNRGGIFLLSAVALLCTTGLVYYFGFSDKSGVLTKNSLASNGSTPAKEVILKPETENTVQETNVNSISNANSNNNEVINTNSSSNAKENNIPVTDNNSTGLNSTSFTKSSVTKTKVQEKTKPDTIEKNTSASTTETKSEKNTKTSEFVNTNETKASENQTNTITKNSESVKSAAKNTIHPVLGGNNQINVKPVASTPTTNIDNNSNKEGEVTNGNSSDENKGTEIVVNEKQTESKVTDSVPAIKTSRADSLKFPPPTGEGISYATNVKMEHNHKDFLFMEAGAAYLLGWSGNNGNDADGFNLVAGLNFQHYFSNNFSAQIGVQYNSIGNMTQTSHTISTVNYDFGIEKDITSIKYQKLHYVVAPIKLAINAGKDNVLGIGCNVAYLLNSVSKKEKYKTNSNDPNAVKNNLTSSKETGYVQGFNPIDVQVAAFYRRKIYKGLSVNAEFIFGLTDTKNNTFFKSNTFERTTGFKLTLCYDLFKK